MVYQSGTYASDAQVRVASVLPSVRELEILLQIMNKAAAEAAASDPSAVPHTHAGGKLDPPPTTEEKMKASKTFQTLVERFGLRTPYCQDLVHLMLPLLISTARAAQRELLRHKKEKETPSDLIRY